VKTRTLEYHEDSKLLQGFLAWDDLRPFFAENGDASFEEIAEMIAKTQGLGGKTMSIGIDNRISQYGDIGRYGVAANSLVTAQNARRLGWSPKEVSLASFLETYVP
jgi:nucleoside-diphosphate-sugar epimerase